jgi:hypothetical protein
MRQKGPFILAAVLLMEHDSTTKTVPFQPEARQAPVPKMQCLFRLAGN